MTNREISISPPNSLVLLMDYEHGELPEAIGGLIAATDSCVAIGTLSEHDGETRIILTDSQDGVVGDVVFEGELLTPSKEISVCSVENAKLLTLPVGAQRARVAVYVNDDSEPDQIFVYVTAAS